MDGNRQDFPAFFMKKALMQAEAACRHDEVPVGCVIVQNGKIIARGRNKKESSNCSIHHAEIVAIERACKKLDSWRLDDCDLYVTLEPCPMCAGAIIQSRIRNVYFGAYDPKAGSVNSCIRLFDVPEYNHHPSFFGGILEEECSGILKSFFRKRRQEQKQKKKERKEAV